MSEAALKALRIFPAKRKIAAMNIPSQQLDDAAIQSLADHGADLLKNFHDEYEKDHTGRKTEFCRGHVAEWKHLLDFIYGSCVTDIIVQAALQKSGLPVPETGKLSEAGQGYEGVGSGGTDRLH